MIMDGMLRLEDGNDEQPIGHGTPAQSRKPRSRRCPIKPINITGIHPISSRTITVRQIALAYEKTSKGGENGRRRWIPLTG